MQKSGHTKDSCFYKSNGSVVASITELDICPVCEESLHKYNVTLKDDTVKEIVGKILLNCKTFIQWCWEKEGITPKV